MFKRILFSAAMLLPLFLAAAPRYLFYTPVPVVDRVPELCAAAPENIKPAAPADGVEVPLLSAQHKSYLDLPHDKRVAFFADPESRKTMRAAGWHPLNTVLEWHPVPAAVTYTVLISENPDLSDSVCVERLSLPRLELTNLEIARSYYWQVFALADNCSVQGRSPVMSFRTEDRAPRLLNLGDLGNSRDLGGRIGLDGRRVRQGKIFRNSGLNDNAARIPDDRSRTMREHPEMREYNDLIMERITACNASSDPVSYLPCMLAPEWLVYQPVMKQVSHDDIVSFLTLDAAPDSFLGVSAAPRSADENGMISLSGCTNLRPAFFIQEFESDADGVMQIGCGADWFWALSFNGEIMIDRSYWERGNGIQPVSKDNYVFNLPVRKGRNVIAAFVGSGSGGWCWCCGAPSAPVSAAEVRSMQVKRFEQMLADAFAAYSSYRPGRNVITAEMQSYMVDVLGIRSDIDLRSDVECIGMSGSPLGPRVTWYHYSSGAYAGMAAEFGRNAFRDVFSVFLKEDNYGIDFHCIAGQDRTGAVAFILNGLLGVAEEELWLDWESTGFWNPSAGFNHKDLFDHLVRVFRELPGADMREKCENYVISLGFTSDDIAKFREIMLEPAGK